MSAWIWALLLALPQDAPVAIKGGRVLTISGPEIDSGDVVVKGGKIEAVGKNAAAPWDATVIDATGKVVIPGFVEAHAFRGLDRLNERIPSVPFVSTFDAINPVDLAFPEALRQGITAVAVFPGNDTLVGGQACVVKPWGATVEAMMAARNTALKISLRPRTGTSRMAHMAALRREFQEAAEAKGEPDPRKEPLVRALKGQLPVFIHCPTASDVVRGVALAETYKLKAKFVVGRDAWKAADELARRQAEVVLDPVLEYWETDEERHEEVLREGARALFRPGIKPAFQLEASAYGSSQMWHQAAVAVRQGVPRDAALKAATLWPAEMLGLGARMGSIEKGKDADLVVLSGDPLDVRTWVDLVILDGRVVYDRSKDERLKRLLEGKPR